MAYGNYGYPQRYGGYTGGQPGYSNTYTAPAPGQMQPMLNVPQNGFTGQMQGGFVVQPVSSREEALAVIADPMVSGVIMPDLGHGMIYFKRFNQNTGVSDFGEFAFVPPQQQAARESAPQVDLKDYVTRTDLDAVIAQLRGEFGPAPRGKAKKEAADE